LVSKDGQQADDLLNRGGHVHEFGPVVPSGCVGVCVDLMAERADEGLPPCDGALAVASSPRRPS